jgi:predicted dehydrogenase
MRQVVQSYKTGEVTLRDVAVPQCATKGILVRTTHSLISLGTERSTIELGRKSLLGKAASRPDLVRRALDKAKKEGLLKTWQEAMGRLDAPTPLGYSSAGVIAECGLAATEFSPGDRVACIGQGYASHAEFSSVPVNLACHIPDGVSDAEAAFGMLGIIALHGVRNANLTFGSNVAVIGLGLLGLLTIQILRAYGCEVVAIDPATDKVQLAKTLGFVSVTNDFEEFERLTASRTLGYGADAVIVTAATKDRTPIDKAIQLCRQKGRIVVVGTADIHPDRNELWQKEIELVVSRAAGPGSLDPVYELEGVDLPIGDIRWTQKRNLREFLNLIATQRINVQPLITHRFDIHAAEDTYHQLIAGKLTHPIGVLLEYPTLAHVERQLSLPPNKPTQHLSGSVQVAVIGAGLFGKALLLPSLQSQPNICLHTLVTSSGMSAEHSGKRFGFLNHATDADFVWKNDAIQAVIGLTPHNQHANQVRQAIQYGKALFIEKPLCTAREELDDLKCIAASAAYLPIVFVGHNRRYSPHTMQMCKWLETRQGPLVLQMRINTGFISGSHWTHSEEQGRSRVVGEMSHFIDLIQTLVGARITRISAERVSGDNRSVVNNDNIAISFKLSDGSVGTMIYSASGDKAYSREATEIFFDGKTIVSHDFRITSFYSKGKTETFKTRNQEIGYKEELKHFVDCVAGRTQNLVPLSDHFVTMETIFSIEHALATAQVVHI